MSRDPLGERRPANVGEALDGPGGDASRVPEECSSIDSMRSESAASCV